MTRHPGSGHGPCFAGSHFSRPRCFPPPIPPRPKPPCSPASQVLSASLTSPAQSKTALPSACIIGYSFISLPDAGLPVVWQAEREISRFPARSVHACLGSMTTRDRRRARRGVPARVAFPIYPQGRRIEVRFRGSIPSPRFPSVTLRPCPHGHRRTERGRSGRLNLHRKELASSTLLQSPGARGIG